MKNSFTRGMFIFIACVILAIFALFLTAGIGEAKGNTGYIVFCHDNPVITQLGQTWQVACKNTEVIKEVQETPKTVWRGNGGSVVLSCMDTPDVFRVRQGDWRAACNRAFIISKTVEFNNADHKVKALVNPMTLPITEPGPCWGWWVNGAKCVEVFSGGELVAVPILPLWLCEQWWDLGKMCFVEP